MSSLPGSSSSSRQVYRSSAPTAVPSDFRQQAGVALKRISVFLEEEEVDEQVSTLKRTLYATSLPGDEEEGLGLENADLKWNEVETGKDTMPKADDDAEESGIMSPRSPDATIGNESEDLEAAVASGELENSLLLGVETEQPRFELKDITVRFPEGKLTVVTGPTASGKTALLVRPHLN